MLDSFDYRDGFGSLVALLIESQAARHMMCSEADRVVEMLSSAGMHDEAIALLQEHVLSDDSYDSHAADVAEV